MKSGRTVHREFARFGLPEVVELGRNNNLAARRPLPQHTHDGAFEIFYLVRGHQVMGASGRRCVLRGNDLFVAQPDEVHSTGVHPMGHNFFFWLQIQDCLPFFDLPDDEAQDLRGELRSLPRPHFPGAERLTALFEQLVQLQACHENPGIRTRMRQCLLEIVLITIDCSKQVRTQPDSSELTAARDYVAEHLEGLCTVQDLAEHVGLSPSRLRARFRAELGVSPSEYILRRRIDRAIEWMIDTDFTITDIAHRLDFSSSQYFATVFKRFMTCSPSKFRNDLAKAQRIRSAPHPQEFRD